MWHLWFSLATWTFVSFCQFRILGRKKFKGSWHMAFLSYSTFCSSPIGFFLPQPSCVTQIEEQSSLKSASSESFCPLLHLQCSLKSTHCFLFLLDWIFKLLPVSRLAHWRVRQTQILSYRKRQDHTAGGKGCKGCLQWQLTTSSTLLLCQSGLTLQSNPRQYTECDLVHRHLYGDRKSVLLWLIFFPISDAFYLQKWTEIWHSTQKQI